MNLISRIFKNKKRIILSPLEVSSKETHLDYSPKGIRVLFISDTHDYLTEDIKFDILTQNYDAVICLGDHGRELEYISKYVPEQIPIYGILGNHDLKDTYEQYPRIQNVGNTVFTLSAGDNKITIAAFEGSFKYKDVSNAPLYTQEEYKSIISKLPGADICIGHPAPYDGTNAACASHQGIYAITEYLDKYNVPIYIHGHLHEPGTSYLKNGTKDICVYQDKIILI